MSTSPNSSKAASKIDFRAIPADSWRPFEPQQGRVVERNAERELERISVWMRRKGESSWCRTFIQDYSLFGFGMLFERGRIETTPQCGETIELKILQGDREELLVPCRVENLTQVKRGLRIGMSRLEYKPEASLFAQDPDLVLTADDPILATVENRYLYRETCEVRLYGLYSNMAMAFVSSDPAMLILPKMRVTVHFHLPSTEQETFFGEVGWIEHHGEEIRFGMHAKGFSRGLSNALGEHFIRYKLGTPSLIQGLGYSFKIFQENLSFAYAQTMEDYQKVLDLRKTAYVGAGKKPRGTRREEMSSGWDRQSRILCALHGEKVVASVALTFPLVENTALRTEEGFPGKQYPVRIADKRDMLEVVNLCTDPAYRNGDLLFGMFTHIARTFILSDRKFLVTVATDQLLPLYLKIGFKQTGHTCAFLNIPHHLIYSGKDTAVYGKGMNVFVWNHLFGELVDDLIQKQLLSVSGPERFMIKLKLKLKPLADFLLRKKMDRQIKAHLKTTLAMSPI